MSEFFGGQWYALYVRSRHEKIVQAQLHAKEHEVFLPLYQTRSKWADRWKTVSLPLFPGYVFCRFDLAHRSRVLATSGIIDLVKTGCEPAAIDPSQIEAIQTVVNSDLAAEPYSQFVKGHPVIMSGGPLKGLTGMVAEVRNSLRLVISIDLLGRSVLVEIDREWVIPYQESTPAYAQLLYAS